MHVTILMDLSLTFHLNGVAIRVKCTARHYHEIALRWHINESVGILCATLHTTANILLLLQNHLFEYAILAQCFESLCTVYVWMWLLISTAHRHSVEVFCLKPSTGETLIRRSEHSKRMIGQRNEL